MVVTSLKRRLGIPILTYRRNTNKSSLFVQL